MSWLEDMNRTAANIAFPDWQWQDGDEPALVAWYAKSWSETDGGEPFTFEVSIERDGGGVASREYIGEAAHRFFVELMRRGEGGRDRTATPK